MQISGDQTVIQAEQLGKVRGHHPAGHQEYSISHLLSILLIIIALIFGLKLVVDFKLNNQADSSDNYYMHDEESKGHRKSRGVSETRSESHSHKISMSGHYSNPSTGFQNISAVKGTWVKKKKHPKKKRKYTDFELEKY